MPAEGKLHRTLRVIDHANQLCPETATKTVALPLELCAERARVPGLLGKVLGKDSTGVEP